MTTGVQAHSLTNLALFREKVSAARRQTGRLQKELAEVLGIDAQVLSRKLHGVKQTFPTHAEVKQIIKTLASWDAITTHAEAIELLSLMGLKTESFSDQEWNSAPLNRLKPLPRASANMAGAAPAPSHKRTPFPLLTPSTSLIGREWLVQMLLNRLRQPAVRLLTLLGTGGVGKTRLALEVARSAQRDFADGVFFVPLPMIRDAALVPSTIVQALGLSEYIAGGDAGRDNAASNEDILKSFLQDKALLLVLDNMEHIPDAVPVISDLLNIAAGLKVVVTSRAVLHLYGEYEFDVPPLEACDPDHLPELDYLAQLPAIRLFVERARAVNPTFQIAANNAATIVRICARLDGLPLAIELAAARTKLLSLPAILDRLAQGTGQSLTFLRSTAQDVPPRHRTLRDMLDWSYELLDARQQRFFRRLGVFLGGWTLEAALAVGLEENPAATLDDALEQMRALIDHSLVKRIALEKDCPHERLEPRFYCLETVREYALGQLEASGECEEMLRRHAAWYLALAERLEPDLLAREHSAAMSPLVREQGNLRAAMAWAIARDEAVIAQRLCGALGTFWELRTQFQEEHRWIDAALKMTQETSPQIRAKLLMAASRLALWEMSCIRSRELAEEALALYEAIGCEAGRARAISQIGGSWHMQGDYAQATRFLEESLPLLREHANWRLYAFALSRLGAIATLQGNFSQAWIWLNEAEPLLRDYSEPGLRNATLVYLGVLALTQGDPVLSMTYLREALLVAQQTGNLYMFAISLIALGCASGRTRAPSYAVRICSAAEALFESLHTALPAAYRPHYHAYLGLLKSQVDEATWSAWWAEGKTLSQEEAIALALAASEAQEA